MVAGTFEAAASASQLQPAAEAKLSAPVPPVQHHQQPTLHFAVSACLWGCLQRTLAPNVFLKQLGDKFARLMTQLLVRYDTWLQEVVRIRQQAATAAPVAVAAQQQQLQGQAPGQPQQLGASADAGVVAAGEVRSGQAAWVPDMPLDSAAVICADADVVKVSGVWHCRLMLVVCASHQQSHGCGQYGVASCAGQRCGQVIWCRAMSYTQPSNKPHACVQCSTRSCSVARLLCPVVVLVQALLQGPLAEQLQERFEGLPADMVQQLVGLMHNLAERIGQHGQQVC